jgi:hypothetical protein
MMGSVAASSTRSPPGGVVEDLPVDPRDRLGSTDFELIERDDAVAHIGEAKEPGTIASAATRESAGSSYLNWLGLGSSDRARSVAPVAVVRGGEEMEQEPEVVVIRPDLKVELLDMSTNHGPSTEPQLIESTEEQPSAMTFETFSMHENYDTFEQDVARVVNESSNAIMLQPMRHLRTTTECDGENCGAMWALFVLVLAIVSAYLTS